MRLIGLVIAAFLEIFGKNKVIGQQSNGKGRVAEASVDVNVALKGGVISSVSYEDDEQGVWMVEGDIECRCL